MMQLLNHFINSEKDGDITINRYISFDIDVREYSNVGESDRKEDKNILCIDLHLDEHVEHEGESSWHSRKSDRHILDFNLKDPDDIYGVACALSCILDNGMAKILDAFNPRTKDKGEK